MAHCQTVCSSIKRSLFTCLNKHSNTETKGKQVFRVLLASWICLWPCPLGCFGQKHPWAQLLQIPWEVTPLGLTASGLPILYNGESWWVATSLAPRNLLSLWEIPPDTTSLGSARNRATARGHFSDPCTQHFTAHAANISFLWNAGGRPYLST